MTKSKAFLNNSSPDNNFFISQARYRINGNPNSINPIQKATKGNPKIVNKWSIIPDLRFFSQDETHDGHAQTVEGKGLERSENPISNTRRQ